MRAFLILLSVPTKFVPLSGLIDLTLPCLAMNLHRAWIKESVTASYLNMYCSTCKTGK